MTGLAGIAISSHLEAPTISYPSVPGGPGNELRVAAFLWDMYDSFSGDDEEIRPEGDANARYRRVGGFFVNMPISSELVNVWTAKIRPTLNSAQRRN